MSIIQDLFKIVSFRFLSLNKKNAMKKVMTFHCVVIVSKIAEENGYSDKCVLKKPYLKVNF